MPQPASLRARTKIVATVGPACRSPEMLRELVLAGVDVFRLNMAHGSLEDHTAIVHDLRRLSAELAHPLAILADLAGPKIRLGELVGGQVECRQGEEVRFVRGGVASAADELVCTYERLLDELAPGDRIMLADGTVSLIVEQVTAAEARCRVVQPGIVRTRQGVNLPGVQISLPALSDTDRNHAVWAAQAGVDYVSLSFVRAPQEVLELKQLLRRHGSSTRVVAKIEKPEAVQRMEEIVQVADAVMVARGDLGVEVDIARVPVVQKQIVAACRRHHKPVIVATQMLDSMQRNRQPTRAEASDVANAILDGCDACMLSGETAVGEHPRAAVEMMNRIALATEPLLAEREAEERDAVAIEDLHEVTRAVVHGVQFIARRLGARLLVVATHSGATALALSKQRTGLPILAVTDNEAALRQMCLYWGVTPLAGAPARDSAKILAHATAWGVEKGFLASGDRLIFVSGIGLAAAGHNMLVVHEIA
ncbi:MAG: pyruvate kinase [Pirellulales bacterium]|nr:pyruvate kinase [Pirellulales bacterium]